MRLITMRKSMKQNNRMIHTGKNWMKWSRDCAPVGFIFMNFVLFELDFLKTPRGSKSGSKIKAQQISEREKKIVIIKFYFSKITSLNFG